MRIWEILCIYFSLLSSRQFPHFTVVLFTIALAAVPIHYKTTTISQHPSYLKTDLNLLESLVSGLDKVDFLDERTMLTPHTELNVEHKWQLNVSDAFRLK